VIGRVLVAVALASRVAVLSLLDQPLWVTTYTYAHMEEERTRQALERRRDRIDAGFMAAFAFNDPAQLQDELRQVQASIADFERGPGTDDLAALRARGQAMADRIEGSGAFPELTSQEIS
jgi:hypothetical protein